MIEVNVLGVRNTVRAVLPEISERSGQIVLDASAAAFLNGVMISAYSASKAAVEFDRRSLRVELAPFGASATVAYFGIIGTRMADEGFTQPGFGWVRDYYPNFMLKPIPPAKAGAAIVRGVKSRAPRVFAPHWWRHISALRGLTNPLLDRRLGGTGGWLR